jgi:hypothetical protein
MHVICLMVYLLISICYYRSTSADNPTSIVLPFSGLDPSYLIAESSSGLANRLRVMAAYMHIAQAKYDGAHLVFVWEINEACPGHFLSLFDPIDHVIFATNASRYVLDKHAKVCYEDSSAVFSWIMRMNGIPKNRFGFPSWTEIEQRMYAKYFPRRELMFKALSFIARHNICNASAMHIRETDLGLHLQRQSQGRRRVPMSREAYAQFVQSRPREEPIYLLTDNFDAQEYFLEKFGREKILVFERIASTPSNQLPLRLYNVSQLQPHLNNASRAEEHRQTTLEGTLLDVVIAAHAKEFKAAPFSSLSELVTLFSKIGKQQRGWCSRATDTSGRGDR